MPQSATDERQVLDLADPTGMLKALVQDGEFELPLLPESSSRLLGLCNDPDCPPRELAECIRRDQSIATHVLRIANSPLYSSGAPIVSIQQSVARLGIQRIREIVLIVSCQGRVFDVAEFDAEVRHSFRHSLGTAAFSQEIARTLRLNVEDAFLSGLLHDIGRPVLLQAVADLQKRTQVEFDRPSVMQLVEQHRILVGGSLIQAWGLPQRVADVISNQRQADAINACQDAKVLSLAAAFTDVMFAEENTQEHLNADVLIEQLNMYPEQVTAVFATCEEILDLINRAQ